MLFYKLINYKMRFKALIKCNTNDRIYIVIIMDRNEPVPVFKTVPVVKERKVPNGKKRTAIKKTGWETAWGRPPARSRQTYPQIHMGQ